MPLMTIARNFFLGNEPTVGFGPLRAGTVRRLPGSLVRRWPGSGSTSGIPTRPSGRCRAASARRLAIARAEYFGARVLILDEPTSALGVKQSAFVLRHIIAARNRGLGVIFITHNVQHALPIGDTFMILSAAGSAVSSTGARSTPNSCTRRWAAARSFNELTRELKALAEAERKPPPWPRTEPAIGPRGDPDGLHHRGCRRARRCVHRDREPRAHGPRACAPGDP